MIRRIRIRDWRPYRDATIELSHPVVFFVAPNGVGKTSVYEAARCCLLGFPKGRAAGRAVRGGEIRFFFFKIGVAPSARRFVKRGMVRLEK